MSALAGQITVLNTSTKGPDAEGSVFCMKAHPDNTSIVWVGNTSDAVTSGNGFPLSYTSDGELVLSAIHNLNQLYFITAVSGQKVCWIILE